MGSEDIKEVGAEYEPDDKEYQNRRFPRNLPPGCDCGCGGTGPPSRLGQAADYVFAVDLDLCAGLHCVWDCAADGVDGVLLLQLWVVGEAVFGAPDGQKRKPRVCAPRLGVFHLAP